MTYEVVVAAPNPDHKLIPGLTANLTIYVMRQKDALLLPTKVFTFEPEQRNDDKNLPQPQGDAADLKLERDQKCVWVVDGGKLIPTEFQKARWWPSTTLLRRRQQPAPIMNRVLSPRSPRAETKRKNKP